MSRSNQPLNTDQSNRNNSTKLAKGTKIIANDEPIFGALATKAAGAAFSVLVSELCKPGLTSDVAETNWSVATELIAVTLVGRSETNVGRWRTS